MLLNSRRFKSCPGLFLLHCVIFHYLCNHLSLNTLEARTCVINLTLELQFLEHLFFELPRYIKLVMWFQLSSYTLAVGDNTISQNLCWKECDQE